MSLPLLVFADTERSADLFHALPIVIGDPFLYAEVGGRRVAAMSALDANRVRALGVEVIDVATLGLDELRERGLDHDTVEAELALRACHAVGIEHAAVPPAFPLGVADHLRAGGVRLDVAPGIFVSRRRVKSAAELAGIGRAQAAADAAMAVAAQLIHALPAGLTSEQVRIAMRAACEERGAELPDDVIVAHGSQGAHGHEAGSGPIALGEPVIVDIWPRDRASRCWSDMTRTFVAGAVEPPAELLGYWRLCRESWDAVLAHVRAGASCRDLYERSCEPFERAGHKTQRTATPDDRSIDGYRHGLGHGVGLEIHERPYLGRGPDALVAGDVIAIEPGCYRDGFGGCRLESLVRVGEDGGAPLTDFPWDL